MSTIIPRDEVHQHSEACADMGEAFQPVAMRLSKRQKRLMKYLEEQFASFDLTRHKLRCTYFSAFVCVCLSRVVGTCARSTHKTSVMPKRKLKPLLAQVLPAGDGFSERAKAVERGQPHLMDEVLWALFDRAEEEQRKKKCRSIQSNQPKSIDALGC